MPKVQIPRERILRTAMDLVIREGNQALTIGRLAKELGCSTQPISWTFGSMEAFREEFAEYVLREFNSREVPHGTGAVQMFAAVGLRYLRAAFDEPNLIHFIRANSQRMVAHGGIGTVFDPQVHETLVKTLSQSLGITAADAAHFIQTSVIYTQGLVSLIVDGTIHIDYADAVHRLETIGIQCLVLAGVPEETAAQQVRLI